MGKPLVRFCEGLECDPWYGGYIVAPPGNQADTEKTNRFLRRGESPSYSKNPTDRDERGACGNGSSRHGCESNEVKVLCRQLLGIGRLAYPMHMKATTCVLLGCKRHGCSVVEKGGWGTA